MQEIFTRYADGEPAEKIAASLNERGLRTRTGKPFVKNSFFQIFRNRRYIGEYRYKAVSYTHLDVYKRQVGTVSSSGNTVGVLVDTGHEILDLRQAVLQGDVYKRQSWGCRG